MCADVLITGGAGFIGSHLSRELLRHGYAVRILDNLDPQVHGPEPEAYWPEEAEFQPGDVRDASAVRSAVAGVEAVVHLAAAVGVGQSMYEMARYTSVNDEGTAVLLEALADRPVRRLVVASSMSVYGEGLYRDGKGAERAGATRGAAELRRGQWDPVDEEGVPLEPVATPESKRPVLSSIYALNKYCQEQMCLIAGAARDVPTVALRFFNAYGPDQALSNPYTGVLAIFASRYLNDRPPLVFEDGRQRRDFVSVHDVARACRLALEAKVEGGEVINIGSGRSISVNEVASQLGRSLGKEGIEPRITGRYRLGDIRHCFADISKARAVLGYEPEVSLEDGLAELAGWLANRSAEDRVESAHRELLEKGLAF